MCQNDGCFVQFYLQMCFAPQRRAIFRHLKFKKWPEHVVFCAFRLANLLRITKARHFSKLELQKLLRECGVLMCFVHFDLQMCFAPHPCHFSFLCMNCYLRPAASASLLFEHQEPRIIEKTKRFAPFLTLGACVSSFW